MGSFQVRLSLQPGEQKQIIFLLGYHENLKDQKFDPPDSQTINKKTVKPVIQKYLQSSNVDLLLRRFIRIGTNCLVVFRSRHRIFMLIGWSISGMPINAWSPSLCPVRHRNLSRELDGAWIPRLKSGSAWIRSYGSFAGARTDD